MTLQAVEAEIKGTADSMGSAVFLALIERIKGLEARGYDEAIEAYAELIRVYTHCRIYQHKVERQVWRGYDSPCGFNTSIANNWIREQNRIAFAIQELNVQKHRLRKNLRDVGINYKKYHTGSVTPNLAVIQNPLKHAPKCLTF
jgi:hypothetical protein